MLTAMRSAAAPRIVGRGQVADDAPPAIDRLDVAVLVPEASVPSKYRFTNGKFAQYWSMKRCASCAADRYRARAHALACHR